MRLISVVLLAGSLSVAPLLAGEVPSSPCLMKPPARSIQLQERGFTWLPGGDFTGPCHSIPADGWSRRSAGPWDLHVHTVGPEGSGRFWAISVGVSSKQDSKPVRGACLSTSTLGWRTLQRYSKGALPWADDINNDGRAELVLWDSFPLSEEASMAQYALVPWVYRLASQHSLVIDWDLTRGLARSLAKEYRSPPDLVHKPLQDLRVQAAQALERFANKRCVVTR